MKWVKEWKREGNEIESGMIHSIPSWNETFHTFPQGIKFINLGGIRMVHYILMEKPNIIFFIL